MQRYALVTGLSNEEPAIIELLHEGPQRPLGVGLNLPKHGRNYPYKPIQPTSFYRKGSDIPEIYHRLCPFNRQLHDAIWLLCLSWRVIPKHHSLDALTAIYNKPEQPVDPVWAEKLGATLAKDRQGRGMIGIMADLRKKLPDLRWFKFDEVESHWK